MSHKTKGINAERELVGLFWENGWGAIRVAGSGSSKHPSPDILVGKKKKTLAIECKTTNIDKKYFSKKNLHQLKTFSNIFGAEPWVAVKLNKKWFFLKLSDLKRTKKGAVISLKLAEEKGLMPEQLLSERFINEEVGKKEISKVDL